MESSRTRDQTHVPCIGRRILNHWATMEVSLQHLWRPKLLVEPSFSVYFVFYRSRNKKKSDWVYRAPISLLSYEYLLCRCCTILCVYTWLLIISNRVCHASVSSENRYSQKAVDLLLLFLLWLLWPTLPKLCWIVVVRVGTLVLFLISGEMVSIFHHWG